jgi:hypothetical protein
MSKSKRRRRQERNRSISVTPPVSCKDDQPGYQVCSVTRPISVEAMKVFRRWASEETIARVLNA